MMAHAEGKGFLPYRDGAAVERGAQVYADSCASCHGDRLEGEKNWRQPGPDGRLPAPPHDPSGHTWHHPDMVLFRLTKYGPEALVGGDYESNMPGFDGVLSDQEIVEVLAYIKSTWPEEIVEAHNARNE
ncbi:c-type cytochrome [Shimia aestuarii]|uniref:c-type cytochrome n=2 Tax=Shimia TaxID=573139 RepID=UPI003D75947F